MLARVYPLTCEYRQLIVTESFHQTSELYNSTNIRCNDPEDRNHMNGISRMFIIYSLIAGLRQRLSVISFISVMNKSSTLRTSSRHRP